MDKGCLTLIVITPGPKTPAEAVRRNQGAKIRRYRKTLGLSQQQLADRIGVTKAAVSDWERGVSSPRPHLQTELTRALNAPWFALFAPPEAA